MKNQKIVKWKIKFVPPDGTLRSTKNYVPNLKWNQNR